MLYNLTPTQYTYFHNFYCFRRLLHVTLLNGIFKLCLWQIISLELIWQKAILTRNAQVIFVHLDDNLVQYFLNENHFKIHLVFAYMVYNCLYWEVYGQSLSVKLYPDIVKDLIYSHWHTQSQMKDWMNISESRFLIIKMQI